MYTTRPRNKINSALNALIREVSTSPQYSQELALRFRREISDPAYILRSPLLADSHPIKKEAQIISDAFEAVTNGMQNPDAMEDLETIGADSAFLDWKLTILAFQAFYRGDRDTCLNRLREIDPLSPLTALIPVLMNEDFPSMRSSRHANSAVDRMLARLYEDDDILKSTFEQLKDCLVSEMDDLFTQTALLAISDLLPKSRNGTACFAIWCLHVLLDEGYPIAQLINGLKALFEPSEVMRMAALATLDEDPEISLLFWLKNLIGMLRSNNIDERELGCRLSLIADLLSKVYAEYDSEDIPEREIGDMYLVMISEMTRLFPRTAPVPVPETQAITARFRALADLFIPGESGGQHKSIPAARPRRREETETPVQLELFKV